MVNVKKRKEKKSDKEASPSAGKNNWVVLVPCSVVWFRGPWVSLVTTDEFSVKVTKITSRIGVS